MPCGYVSYYKAFRLRLLEIGNELQKNFCCISSLLTMEIITAFFLLKFKATVVSI